MPDGDDRQPVDNPFTSVLVGFAHELRAAGLTVGTGDVLTYFAAMTPLDPTDLVDLYWAGKTTLLTRHEDSPTYDRVFRGYFLGEDAPARSQLMLSAQSVAEAEAALVMPGHRAGSRGGRGAAGPRLDGVWRGRAQEPVLHRVHAGRARRPAQDHDQDAADAAAPPDPAAARPARGTEPDMRATIRASMRMHGEPPGQLFFRKRKTKLRPLILILDVSGSMADYSRHLFQFAHTARHAAARATTGRVEVFCFGTRLTRITRELAHQRVDAALDEAARTGGLGRRHQDRRVARHLRQEVGQERPVPWRGGGQLLLQRG